MVIQHRQPDPQRIEEVEDDLALALARVAELDRAGKLPPELAALVRLAPPPGLRARVSLRHRDSDRRIRGSAGISTWRAEACGAWIEYVADRGARSEAAYAGDAKLTDDLVRVLLDLELRPRKFTSWNWLRDQHLPARGWTLTKERIQHVLELAVRLGIARTRKVPNPKQPDFPVTSLELNHEHPKVRSRLETSSLATRFEPVELPGKPVSSTILEDRR